MSTEKPVLKQVAEAPAVALEKGIQATGKTLDTVAKHRHVLGAKRIWKILGPGLISGAADDDPAAIATYIQTGSRFGYQLLWLSILTIPLMGVVQEMCARIGLVTGRGLATNIRLSFPRWVLYVCVIVMFFANILNIGANVGAMAKAADLIFPFLPYGPTVVGLTFLMIALQIFVGYRSYARFLKWAALTLIAYVIAAVTLPGLNWGEILRSAVVPEVYFSREQIFLICAVLGTTIAPYLFFWQTSQEVEEEIDAGKTTVLLRQAKTSARELRNMKIDVWSGMFFSNIVMFCIMVTASATLHAHGIVGIETAEEAAATFQPLAGQASVILFSLGILGTGLVAVPVLAGSLGYIVAETLQMREGLFQKLHQARTFYSVIIIASLLGLLVQLFKLNAIQALLYASIGNGLVASVILLLVLLLSRNKKVMGEHVNRPWHSMVGWFVFSLILSVDLLVLYYLIFP